MRKAQISLQFNWIFIFIVGAIIMVFFLMVIKNQTKDANYELAGDIIQNLDTIVKSSEQTEGTFKMISLPPSTIEFICEEGYSHYDIGNGIGKDIPYDIIFAQQELTGSTLLSWTQSWGLPFKIASFQYLTTKNSMFIIVEDAGNLAQDLYDMIPGNVSKKLITRTEVFEDNQHSYYKIIYFNPSDKPTNLIIASENVHELIIEPGISGDLDSYGELTFISPLNGIRSTDYSYFIKLESLLGAIFAQDYNFYECTMDKAFIRLRTLMNLAVARTEILHGPLNPNLNENCETFLEWVEDDISNILSNARLDRSENLYQHSMSLERGNKNLMRGRNCPLIY